MTASQQLALGCIVAVLHVGCGGDDTEPPPEPPPEVQSCPDPLALMLPDGTCIRPGIPPDGCAEGFVHDGEYGCEPILPPETCAPGLMAVPGDTACRPVMACGAGKWGDIPVDAGTIYVDAAYTGGANDGSEARPWTTVSEAVTAAPSGALVAIAEGTYSENVFVAGKPVRLFGVCPEKVSIRGTSEPAGTCPPTALCIAAGAHGSEVRGLAFGGVGVGVLISGSQGVLIEAVWVHDSAKAGFGAEAALGATAITVRDSLIEQNHEVGLLVGGSEALLERVVVRGTLPRTPDQVLGRGISIQTPFSRVTVRGSLVEQNHEIGMFVSGSEANVEASVVRSTLPQASDQSLGWGMSIQVPCDASGCDATQAARVTMSGSLVEQSHDAGLVVGGSEATVDGSVVRATAPRALDQTGGHGVSVTSPCTATPTGPVCDGAARGRLTMRTSLVEQNHDVGLDVHGSDAFVEASVVRATLPQASDQTSGRGMGIQVPCSMEAMGIVCDPSARGSAIVRASLVEQNNEVGLFVAGSDATVEGSVVRATVTQASDGLFGDGVTVFSLVASASATITNSRVDDSARAGIASFGALVSLAGSRIGCAEIDLAGERFEAADFMVSDGGDNLCGCPSADGPCKVLSTGLEPPAPLASAD